MLKTEEIREICDKHQLTRMEVYNIRSLFAGMCLMSKEDEQKELQAQRAAQDGGKAGKSGKGGNALDGLGGGAGDGAEGEGRGASHALGR